MGAHQKLRWLYLLMTMLISASVLLGFSTTYLTKEQLIDDPQSLPLAVHVHGLAFLSWYVLLVIQAILVMRRKMRMHRLLGTTSLLLAFVMITSGLLVIAVQIKNGLEGDEFWAASSLAIFANLITFCLFFGAALLNRGSPEVHRRCMIIAAATASGAAQFRNFLAVSDAYVYAVPTGILGTNLFLVLAMVGEWVIHRRISRLYAIALPAIVGFECAMLWLAFTDAGVAIQSGFVDVMKPFLRFY